MGHIMQRTPGPGGRNVRSSADTDVPQVYRRAFRQVLSVGGVMLVSEDNSKTRHELN